ncbi:ribonuclease III [Leptospira ilyithenensis]|uniref:ribonuclease III n=1 Tax=Leptospira ilyithenensis TaxID=2484901 RepID=UPI001FEA2B69|nr:ribonuclease III [Leptospira ilyithenensis]
MHHSHSYHDSKNWQNPARLGELNSIQSLTDTKFKDLKILHQAFVHRSFANELDRDHLDNERLEFLGDSILGLLAADYLYRSLPKGKEGKLAKLKSKIVSAPAIAAIARKYKFNQFLLLGKGEKEKGEFNTNLQADCFEAFLGALYLDQGLEECRRFLEPNFKNMEQLLDEVEETKDFKTILQEHCQKKWKKIPIYEVMKEEGPDHEKLFLIAVSLDHVFQTEGRGKNKRSAEQNAAKLALSKLGLL